MINITEEYIDAMAPNSKAIANAMSIIKKNSFVKLYKDEGETVIFGECAGSGKDNYIASVDFVNPENPISRCTCPSRQFPCKHALALMYAYHKGKNFTVKDIPQDVLEKREKVEKREEKKKEAIEIGEVKKVNKSALTKKMKAQLEGLELLEKIINNLIQGGLGSIDAKAAKLIEEQSKQLGNYYLPTLQVGLKSFALLMNCENKEAVYTDAFNMLLNLNSICKKGKEYLLRRIEDKDMAVDTSSYIEELLGHSWQLSELEELGCFEENVELVQLSFNMYASKAKQEFLDNGIWIDMSKGKIYETLNYRPFKAVKYVKEEDSFFSVQQVKKLYIYPADMNPRVRWEEAIVRDMREEDYLKIKCLANKGFNDVIKVVKNQIKNPLGDKNPRVLLAYSIFGKVGESFVLEDEAGQRIVLQDVPNREIESCHMINMLKPEYLKNQAILVKFYHNMDSNELRAVPLSIVTDSEIIRLIY